MRVAIYSHGHPHLQTGGTEVASYNLFLGLSAVENVDALYVAYCSDSSLDPRAEGLLQFDRHGREYIFFASNVDTVFFYNTEVKFIYEHLVPFLEQKRIEVLHCHHFLGLGLNGLMLIKRHLPRIKIVLTLHEYLAICLHHGQMVTRPQLSLCQAANPFTCSRCFPELDPRQFVLREELFKRAFSAIDAFICPSYFAINRFLEWGLPGDVVVLENGHHSEATPAPPAASGTERPLRVGFFGSFTPFKGMHVVLEAARILHEQKVKAEIAIHGVLTHLDADTRGKFEIAIRELSPVLRYYGPYSRSAATSLMDQCDWILVASIWWENSPVVLEEALLAKRPVLVSDLGGMREKVAEGRDGLMFRAGDQYDLAEKIKALAEDPGITERFIPKLREVKSLRDAAMEHLQFYAGATS
jgi:glycosyltransferase involved in cell wall biosynthesis